MLLKPKTKTISCDLPGVSGEMCFDLLKVSHTHKRLLGQFWALKTVSC